MKLLCAFAAAVLLAPLGLALAQEGENEVDVRAVSQRIQKLVQAKNLEGAEKALDAALKASPDNVQIASLQRMMAFVEQRAKRNTQAVAYATAYFDGTLERFSKNPESAAMLASAADTLLQICRKAEQSEAGAGRVQKAVAAIKEKNEKEPQTNLAVAQAQLAGTQVLHLAEIKEAEKAAAMLDAELKLARRSYAMNGGDLGAILALAHLLDTHADFLDKTSPDKEPAARAKFREFVSARAKEHSTDAEMVSLYLNTKLGEFYDVVQSDLEAAQNIRSGVKEYLAHLEGASPDLKGITARGGQLLEGMSRQMQSTKAHQAMVGKPATELDVEAWVNGESLTDKDLEGKVVLLDFWAVWCGPCIATFPHLRDWQEKYSDKGLVIIGMTRYYQYDWDDAAEGIERVEGLEPEKERAAMVRFAAHHKLKHRFGVMPEKSEFAESYGVQGIPQVVLIDRAGKVRMIRVGSGSRNAHDLEDAIKQALAVPAAAGGE